jgi:hypothetical protein
MRAEKAMRAMLEWQGTEGGGSPELEPVCSQEFSVHPAL